MIWASFLCASDRIEHIFKWSDRRGASVWCTSQTGNIKIHTTYLKCGLLVIIIGKGSDYWISSGAKQKRKINWISTGPSRNRIIIGAHCANNSSNNNNVSQCWNKFRGCPASGKFGRQIVGRSGGLLGRKRQLIWQNYEVIDGGILVLAKFIGEEWETGGFYWRMGTLNF